MTDKKVVYDVKMTNAMNAPKAAFGTTGISKTSSKPSQAIDFRMQNALKAPKREVMGGIRRGDSSQAQPPRDFTPNSAATDQSVETAPRAESLRYEVQSTDQSVESEPRAESLKYEVQSTDQSVENEPRAQPLQIETVVEDQSTENTPTNWE